LQNSKQSGKGLKSVSLGTGKGTHQAKAQSKIYCICKQGKTAKIKKRSRCFIFDVD
jgi:hypothetical protein